MGFEPTTSCLGSKHSTPELRPLEERYYTIFEARYSVGLEQQPIVRLAINSSNLLRPYSSKRFLIE